MAFNFDLENEIILGSWMISYVGMTKHIKSPEQQTRRGRIESSCRFFFYFCRSPAAFQSAGRVRNCIDSEMHSFQIGLMIGLTIENIQ